MLKVDKRKVYRKESLDPEIKNVYALMDEEVKKISTGSDFFIFTPWLYGERAPINNSYVRAGFVNLCINHKRENLLRAFYEGVGYNLRWIIEVIEKGLILKFLI
ncbi:MAG: FGGY-family carbohydrate kinase [Caldisericia bacterium]